MSEPKSAWDGELTACGQRRLTPTEINMRIIWGLRGRDWARTRKRMEDYGRWEFAHVFTEVIYEEAFERGYRAIKSNV